METSSAEGRSTRRIGQIGQRETVLCFWTRQRPLYGVRSSASTIRVKGICSFTRDILPLFERLAGLQWVNAGFAAGFGWEGTFDLTTPEALARLGSNGPAERRRRSRWRGRRGSSWWTGAPFWQRRLPHGGTRDP